MATATAAQPPSPGVTWLPLGSSMPDGPIEQAVTMNDALYVIYSRPNAPYGDQTMARWDGSSWLEVTSFDIGGSHLDALAAYNGELYIGGKFTSVNGIPGTAGIARWDGAAWSSVGGGMALWPDFAEVVAMEEFNGELYCTGSFISAGGVTVNGIARWDGSRWASLGKGLSDPGTSLTVLDGTLYVAGGFGKAGDALVDHIARWDGNVWSGLKWRASTRYSTIDGRDILLTSFRGELYMHAYYFGDASYWSSIDKLTDSGWNGLGFSLPVSRFQVFDDMLYTSESPFYVDYTTYVGLKRWNGNEWEVVDSFPRFEVSPLTVYRGALIVGGTFQNYGSNHVSYLAMMCENNDCGPLGVESPTASDGALAILPNPTAGEVLLRGTIRSGPLRVDDMFGRTVMSALATGGAELRLDLSSLPSGIYFLSLPGEHGPVTRQVTVVR